jgi:predicted dienelactone hydrolase
MFGAVRSDHLHDSPSARYPRVLQPLCNLLLRFGFVDESRHHSSQGGSPVAASSRSRKFFPSMPRDFVRRRRLFRNLSNFLLIGSLSLGAAYVIARPVGGRGFTPVAKTGNASASPSETIASQAVDSTAIVATGGTASPASVATDSYNLAAGPHTVTEVSDLVLHDAKRNKDLHVRVFYPAEPGKYPVIVFSHGAGGSQTCCEALTRHWASYGYVTIQPTHDDSALLRRNGGEEDIRFTQAVRDAMKKPALWQSRPADISFVIDSFAALQNRVPGLQGKIDAERVGVAGHSMGSYTAEAVAGALIDLPNHPGTTFADPRVKAVLCLSPQGPGQFGLTEHSFDRISLPYLGVTGSLDSLGPVASPAWHKVPFDRSVEGDKFHVFIEGANHMSFIAARTVSMKSASRGEAILAYTNSAALAFWDAYLKDDSGAKSYLGSNRLETQSHNAAKLYRR